MPEAGADLAADLRLVPALAALGGDVLASLAAVATTQRLAAGAVLVAQDAPVSAVFVLVRGALKVVRIVANEGDDDTTVVLDVLRAPRLVLDASAVDGAPATASVEALRASHVLALERRAVMSLAEKSPALARVIYMFLAETVRRHVRRIDEVAAGPVDARVRHLLEGLAHDHGTPVGRGRFIAIPLRRRDIACMVNATTETVSRLLARFEREGLARSTREGIWWRAAQG